MTTPSEQLRIHLTGETGGTGSSTAASQIAEKLNLPKLSGGTFFRALSYAYHDFRQSHENTEASDTHIWSSFKTVYKNMFETHGIAGILSLISPHFSSPSNEGILKTFQKQQHDYDPHEPFWDIITDQFMMLQAHEKPGYVWESKLAVVIPQIDQLQILRNTLELQRTFSLPIMKVLLTAQPGEAARRISHREGVQTTAKQVIERQTRDWQRYSQIYSTNGNPLSLHHIQQTADGIIDTTHINSDLVTKQILAIILKKILCLTGENEAINSIKNLLRQ